MFDCLKSQESSASLPPPRRHQKQEQQRPRTQQQQHQQQQPPPSSPCASPASPSSPSPPRILVSPNRRSPSPTAGAPRHEKFDGPRGKTETGGRQGGVQGWERRGGGLPAASSGAAAAPEFSSDGGGSSSREDFPSSDGREEGEGGPAARFSTEWAYRLAVTKLTAQLRAARERLRGEKEASKLARERVEQARKGKAVHAASIERASKSVFYEFTFEIECIVRVHTEVTMNYRTQAETRTTGKGSMRTNGVTPPPF